MKKDYKQYEGALLVNTYWANAHITPMKILWIITKVFYDKTVGDWMFCGRFMFDDSPRRREVSDSASSLLKSKEIVWLTGPSAEPVPEWVLKLRG